MSWKQALHKYRILVSKGEKDKQQTTLLEKLVKQPRNPKAWLDFLAHEESNDDGNPEVAISLKQLYTHAWGLTKTQEKNEPLWELGVKTGEHYWKEQLICGRAHFKMLEGLGGREYMPMYLTWANLEHSSGNRLEASKLISKALKRRVQPQKPLEDMRLMMETEGALDETEKNANEAFSEQHRSNCALRSDLAKENSEPGASSQCGGILQHNTALCPPEVVSTTKPLELHPVQEATTGNVSTATRFGPPHRVERNSTPLSSASSSNVSSGGGHKRQKVDSTKVNTLFQETESGDCALYSKDKEEPGGLPSSPNMYAAQQTESPYCAAPESLCNISGRLSPIKEESCLKQETMDGSKLAANSTFSYSWAVEKTIQDDPGMKAGLQSTTPGSSSRNRSVLWETALLAIHQFDGDESSRIKNRVVSRGHPQETSECVIVRGHEYRILECIGRGGSSKVFRVSGKAISVHGNKRARECRVCALKRCEFKDSAPDVVEGYKSEVKLLRDLRNKPGIVQMIDWQIWEEPGILFILMEAGETTLDILLQSHKRLQKEWGCSSPDWCFIGFKWKEMVHAVRVIHEHRVVHSDLKPANFLMVEGQLKLIDFGIAGKLKGDATSIKRETRIGSVSYMAPETLRLECPSLRLAGVAQEVSQPSDIWSLGVILYQIVHGELPFSGSQRQKIDDILNENHEIYFPDIDNKDCTDVLRRCLTRNPAERITIEELLQHRFISREQPDNKDLVSSPEGKLMLQRALHQALPEGEDPELVSRLYGCLKDNLKVQSRQGSDIHNEGTPVRMRSLTGLPEGTSVSRRSK